MRRLLLLALLVPPALLALAVPAHAAPDAQVPRVEGLDLDRAVQRLDAVGLGHAVVWTAEGVPGTVQAQQPEAGDRVPRDTVVELVVTRRVEITTIVPNVVGLGADEAIAALEDVYALEIEERTVRPEQEGRVIASDPRAGTRLLLGTTLRLLVGRARRTGFELPVPDVRHMVLDEAEGVLLDLGLVPVPTFVAVRRGAAGRVRKQDPAAGSPVVHGSRVELEVGLVPGAARRARVPSLYGLEPLEAARALAALGLDARVERLPSRFARETVIRQDPRAGTQATLGSAVRLVVAYPAGRTHVPARVQVPQLEGRTLPAAFAAARQAGVQLDVVRYAGPGRHAGNRVLAQRPTAAAAVPIGSRVRIEVPLGTSVPDLVGLTAETAALRVWEAGLRLDLEGGLLHRPGLRVVAQVPDAGTLVPADTVVRAVLAVDPGVGLVLVPELDGLSVAQAETRLRAAGLHAVLSGPPVPAGAVTRVVAQSPSTGTRVPRGTNVQVAYRLAVAVGPLFVLVPDLRGRSMLDAHRLLTQQGLQGVATTVRGPGPKGVTGQEPAPGTRVRKGVKVRFTVRR